MKDSRSRENAFGPYRLGRRLRGTGELGRVHRAYNVQTGAPALVLLPPEHQWDAQPLADWQVRACSSVSPPYLALEVERAPQAPPSEAAEELVSMLGDLCSVAERVADKPQVLSYLQGRPWRQRVRKARVWGALAAGVAALLAVGTLWLRGTRPPDVGSVEVAGTRGDGGRSNKPTTGLVLTDQAGAEPILLARPMPKKPFEEQKRPPCDKDIETEFFGGCWVATDKQAPCPDKLYEFQGKCYLPAARPRQAPTAITR